ncbi:unnamed protein product [Somion occarium]|uniref:RNI-like protein n=1 Tax=Somion occarium TaxID=3059160 RepID=A0ABP1DV28_9APHY
MSSPSPSSSAVTIPTPGKSILKRPPPQQQSFLARITKLLPQTNAQTGVNDEAKSLKRAHFILPEMTTVYPISSSNPPSTPSLKEEKRSIEEREAERRKRVVRRNSAASDPAAAEDPWWTLEQVESFYRECCVGREEAPDPAVSAALLHTNPRTVDLSGVQLTVGSASVLSDVFTIEWGLRKLVFKECDLDEHILKPMLHALLIPNSLVFLSVASNRRLKPPAFRLIGAYLTKARSLQFLDVSQNSLDKRSVEYIAAALPAAPTPGLTSLRLDDCALRPTALDSLAHVVRVSSLRNISLRYNKISASGAVAVALMMKDYPDRYPISSINGSATSSANVSPTSSVTLLSPPATPTFSHVTFSAVDALPPTPPPRSSPILPPPRHPSTAPQTTYTPYIPRSKRLQQNASNNSNPLSPTGQPIPLITSSAQGGITTRHPVPPSPSLPTSPVQNHDHGPSAALLDKVRALDSLPRLGALRTLDLRGNDIRGAVSYIAQVLKRNRTLKVLNLSENKLDVQALVVIAEALKYNSCLETLDLSKNPCCGPSLEGVQSLRTAFTLNNALKRLFLSSTSMTSAGAIALAEFLPESTSLLHLDLTMNNLDLAGVMALSSGLKANHIMRCLDLNIPPSDEQMARMCRDILNTCVRNTEEAERHSDNRGQSKGIWGMIQESELAKTFRQDEKKKVEDQIIPSSPISSIDTNVPIAERKDEDVVAQAKSCKADLEDFIARSPSSSSAPVSPKHRVDPVLKQRAQTVLASLASLIEATGDPNQLEVLLTLNDELTGLMSFASCSPTSANLNGLGIRIDTEKASFATSNGHIVPADASDVEEEPVTPRVDKGKARAEPEPEEPEKVLTPTTSFRISESDDEDDVRLEIEEGVEDVVSPTDRSRSLVAEEGEVFRKGVVLLGPEEMEGEYDGEELRKELLEAMVERPPPRSLQDGFLDDDIHPLDVPPPTPVSPQESAKPPPRPYVRRSRSSSTATVTLDTQNLHSVADRLKDAHLHRSTSANGSPISSSPSSTPSLSSRSSSKDSR